MRKYKIDPELTSYYFCTSTIVEWQCVFKEEKYFRIIIDSLNFCREHKGLYLLGYVIMLNHIHLIVSTDFVIKPEDWKYSSARNWYQDDHSVITLDLKVL